MNILAPLMVNRLTAYPATTKNALRPETALPQQFGLALPVSSLNAPPSIPGIAASASKSSASLALTSTPAIRTSIRISGAGYLTLAPHGEQKLYTQSCSFAVDKNGHLTNAAGQALVGLPLGADGSARHTIGTHVQPIKIPASVAQAATSVALQTNLEAYAPTFSEIYDPSKLPSSMASGAVTPSFSEPIPIFDSTGVMHSLTASFLKTANDSWAVEIYAQASSDVKTDGRGGQVASGTITFNGDGSLHTISQSLAQPIRIRWTNGAADSAICFNWGTAGSPFGTAGASVIGRMDGVSQFSSGYSILSVTQNGAPRGHLTGVTIRQDGDIVASYNNGVTLTSARVLLSEFANPAGLKAVAPGLFSAAHAAGNDTFVVPGTHGAGLVLAGSP